MAVFKRYKGAKITADHPNWKDARWCVEFLLKGKRTYQALPEARTQQQAERAEVKLREDIYNRRYGNSKLVGVTQFFEQNYLPWLKEHRAASAYRDAVSRGKLIKEFFGDQSIQDITAIDCERFKAALKKDQTPRKSLRSDATVNRYIYLLSAICTRAIREDVISVNPCARLANDPEQSRARYLTPDEEVRLLAAAVDDLEFLRIPILVSLNTGLRKCVELLKLKIGHLNFGPRPVFCSVRGGNVEIPPGWLIVLKGKRGKYRLIPMNSQVRALLLSITQERQGSEFVFTLDSNWVTRYTLRRGFELACERAGIVFGETKDGGIIWHDLRRTFATRLRAHGVHEYDIQDLLGHSKPGVTKVYARATVANLEQAVEKLTQPLGQVVEFERRVG